ncbi:MAG: hypothetical protein EAZ76_07560 [Nostocales cyanobacterium]|nr:MAG: hypothetical protein EAZ87_21845 [Nostocales cyanobacterium]TAF16367.1 MAG: hypothetical protein EAZ76_07560 [Nostocales cyanobacterium]
MRTVVKLTQEYIIGEIESVLDTYPYQPYQQAFAIPDLHQELINFVINRLPGFSSQFTDHEILLNETNEAETEDSFHHKLSRNPLEQKLHLQNLINQGISSIIQQKSELISHHLCETVQPGCQPSSWFG